MTLTRTVGGFLLLHKNMAEKYFKQKKWSSGLSDSDRSGFEGSVSVGVGVDIFSEPNILKVSQALVKESSTIMTSFGKVAVHASDGNSYFGGDDGKIFKRTSGGTYSEAHDAGTAILDIEEFDGYIYYTRATTVGRQALALAASEATWSSETDSYGVLTSATYHPMQVLGLYLFIGNKSDIASIDDAGTFTATGTPDVTFSALPHNYIIKTLGLYGIDILIGTEVGSTYQTAKIFRWDTVSPTYNYEDEISQNGINAIFKTESDEVYVQAGTNGDLYRYDGQRLQKRKSIPGTYENKTMTVHPGSVANFKGIAVFGVSNLSGNPCLQGVYALGKYDENYPLALMLHFVISQNKTSAIEIGAILSIGDDLLVSWKDSTTYGVDKISWTAKYASAYIETLLIGGNREEQKFFEEYAVSYKSLPASTALALSYDSTLSGSYTGITLTNNTTYDRYFAQQDIEAGTIKLKLAFTTSANNAPEVEEFYTKWYEEGII